MLGPILSDRASATLVVSPIGVSFRPRILGNAGSGSEGRKRGWDMQEPQGDVVVLGFLS